MTHSYETWLIHMRHDSSIWDVTMTHSSVRHDSSIWDMTHKSLVSEHNMQSTVGQLHLRSRVNESCLIWMSHVSYEWGMSHTNESCLIWMRHVTYETQVPDLYTNRNKRLDNRIFVLVWMSHVSYEWVTSHTNESCLIYVSHVSYIWVTSINESCLVRMSHVSYEWVTSHMNESCLIYMSHFSYETQVPNLYAIRNRQSDNCIFILV